MKAKWEKIIVVRKTDDGYEILINDWAVVFITLLAVIV